MKHTICLPSSGPEALRRPALQRRRERRGGVDPGARDPGGAAGGYFGLPQGFEVARATARSPGTSIYICIYICVYMSGLRVKGLGGFGLTLNPNP